MWIDGRPCCARRRRWDQVGKRTLKVLAISALASTSASQLSDAEPEFIDEA